MELKAKKLTGFRKTRGLLGAANPFPVYFHTRFGIHTFGLKFPIDVLILDHSNKVIKTRENLVPNQIFLWNPKYKAVLELPGGEVEKHKIKKGDTLRTSLF
jgi:uncharacterized protein